MGFIPVEVPPGVVKSDSPYAASGRFIDMDHVRFVRGKPQKIGGNIQFFDPLFTGIARKAKAWASYTGVQCLMFGTACTLYLYREGTLSSVTPYRLDSTSIALPNPFTTSVAANFALATENDAFTKIMLHFDGVDASTTFTDVSVGGGVRVWTAAGNAQIDTAQTKFGVSSGLFDGTGDWITTPDSADFTLGAGDWTIDCWIKSNSTGTTEYFWGQSDAAATVATISTRINRGAGGTISAQVYVGGAPIAVTSTTVITNAVNPGFNHVALVRTGNVLKLFINGVQEGGNVAIVGSVQDSANAFRIGAPGEVTTNTWNGWIDEFRLSVGVARWTANFTPPTAAYRGQTIVTVADAAHGISAAGVIVNFSGATVVGGVTISGDYAVTSVIDANTYTITYPDVATSSAGPGGGAGVIAKYTLNCGTVDPTYLLGWGVGTWGDGGWGTDASIASALITEPTNWSMDVWGEDLIINQLNNGIWVYDTSTGATRPAVLANAPAQVRYVFVTAERYIFALGCTNLAGNFDPMTVRWPDIEVTTDWTPSATDTGNERKLQGGTRLMCGAKLTDGVSAVWSDAGMFIFQFTGAAGSIYSSRMVAEECGIVGQQAFAVANGNAYWMGATTFHMYSGSVEPIPNVEDILEWVRSNVSQTMAIKSYAFYNAVYNEIWFVFPGLGSNEPSIYVAVKLTDFSWIHGTIAKSAVATYTVSENRPIMFSNSGGKVMAHETRDNPNDDGAAMPFHLELAPSDIQSGNTLVDIFGFVPDFERQQGSLSLYLYGLDHPRDTIMSEDTQTIAPTDKLVDLRVAGRQFGMILSGSATNVDFRLGKWGLEIQGAGKKRGSQAP